PPEAVPEKFAGDSVDAIRRNYQGYVEYLKGWERSRAMIDVPVQLGARSYHILVGQGCLAQAGPELGRLKVGRKVVLVTDAAILALHGAAVTGSLAAAGFELATALVPEGERAKTLEVAASTWERFLEAGLDRSSTVVALGGG